MLVLRPADAVEAAECWEIALRTRTAVLADLRPPGLPAVRRQAGSENLSARGAYVLEEATAPAA